MDVSSAARNRGSPGAGGRSTIEGAVGDLYKGVGQRGQKEDEKSWALRLTVSESCGYTMVTTRERLRWDECQC